MRRERSDTGSEDGSVPTSKRSVRRALEFDSPPQVNSSSASNDNKDKHETASEVVQATNEALEKTASASADDAASTAPIIHNSSITSSLQVDQRISGHNSQVNSTLVLLPLPGVSIDQKGKQAVEADDDVHTFAKPTPTNISGLLQDLNPGIIRQVRNSQRVLSVLHDFIEGTDSSSSVDLNRLGSGPSRVVPSVVGQGGSRLDHDSDSSTADFVDNGNAKQGSSSHEIQNQPQK